MVAEAEFMEEQEKVGYGCRQKLKMR